MLSIGFGSSIHTQCKCEHVLHMYPAPIWFEYQGSIYKTLHWHGRCNDYSQATMNVKLQLSADAVQSLGVNGFINGVDRWGRSAIGHF